MFLQGLEMTSNKRVNVARKNCKHPLTMGFHIYVLLFAIDYCSKGVVHIFIVCSQGL
jgi:hypothetical protein